MSLLKRIQDGTLDRDGDLSSLLRLCKVFARQVNSNELTAWADRELNGYPRDGEVPAYRLLSVSSKGHFSGPMGMALRGASMPIHCLPEAIQPSYREARIAESVGSLQAMVGGSDTGFTVPWPMEVLAVYGADMFDGYNCVQAWKVLNRGSLQGILDSVKNKVLDFTLALQEQHPDLMKSDDQSPNTPPREEVRNVFNTTIYGTVGALANASTNVRQTVAISRNDWSALETELRRHGVPKLEVSELRDSLEADRASTEGTKAGFGPRVTQWLGRALVKVGAGAWSTTVETAGKVLPPLIAGYLGITL